MKVSFNGYKLKFKRKHCAAVLPWLSGLVHTLAAIKANTDAAKLEETELASIVPEFVSVHDGIADSNTGHLWLTSECLDDLKAARRKIAAVVQLGRM